jgi:hypothetical protein
MEGKMEKIKSVRTFRQTVTITVNGQATVYHVSPMRSDYHLRAYQFRKEDGTVYHVAQERTGKIECDCGDSLFRDHRCKHARVGVAMGLFLQPREVQAVRWYEERK